MASSEGGKKLENNDHDPPMEDLCATYLRILDLMHMYHDEKGFFPTADSSDFHEFTLKDGLPDISQSRLTHAIQFMEESYRDYARVIGINARFYTNYLKNRFQLSKKIWGRDEVNRDQEDSVDRDEKNIFEGHIDNDEEQSDMNIALLEAIFQFKNSKINGGMIPKFDSVAVYVFLVDNAPQLQRMPQDRLVDRIMMLEESFNWVDINQAAWEIEESNDPRKQRILYLSNMIWDDPNDALLSKLFLIGGRAEQETLELQVKIVQREYEIEKRKDAIEEMDEGDRNEQDDLGQGDHGGDDEDDGGGENAGDL